MKYDQESARRADFDAVNREFDEMFERMQRPSHRKAVDRLFQMTGEELGEVTRQCRLNSDP